MTRRQGYGFPGAVVMVLSAGIAWSQVIPAHPHGFKNRSLGPESAQTGASVAPKEVPKVRHVTHLVLSGIRQWTSADGRQVIGKLIAFEDVEVETAKGERAPEPKLPENPTLVRDGKVRLLVKQQASVVPLERLSEADQEFVEQTRLRLAKKPVRGSEEQTNPE